MLLEQLRWDMVRNDERLFSLSLDTNGKFLKIIRIYLVWTCILDLKIGIAQ